MADEKKRIAALEEKNSLSNDDFIPVDNMTGGTKKFKLKKLTSALEERMENVEEDWEDLSDNIGPIITDWLDENVDPVGSAVVVDSSLAVSGAAADSKKVGDELSDLNNALKFIGIETITGGYYAGPSFTSNANFKSTSKLPCFGGDSITVTGCCLDNQYVPAIVFYKADGSLSGSAGKNVGGDSITTNAPSTAATFRVNSKNAQHPEITYDVIEYTKNVQKLFALDNNAIQNTYSVYNKTGLSDLNDAPNNSIGFFQIPVATTAENMPAHYPGGTTVIKGYGVLLTVSRSDGVNSIAQFYISTQSCTMYTREGSAGTWTDWLKSDITDKIQQSANAWRGWKGHDDDAGFERIIIKLNTNANLYFTGAASSNQYFYYLEFVDANGGYLTGQRRRQTGNTEDTVAYSDFPSGAVYAVITYARGNLVKSTITNGNILQVVPANTFDMLQKIASAGASETKAEIVIPSTITAVVGDTLQVFYDSIVKPTSPVEIEIKGTKGNALERYFEYTPVAGDVGTSTLTINVQKYADMNSSYAETIATKNVTLNTINVPSSPVSEKHILCIGDSTIVGGDYVKEIARRICGTGGTPTGNGLSNIKFMGRLHKTVGDIDVGYEGFSGWSWSTYISSAAKAIRFYVSGVTSLNFEAVYQDGNGCKYNISEINVTDGSGNIRCLYVMGSATTTPSSSGTLTRISGSGDETITYSSIDVEEYSPFYTNGNVDFETYVDEYCGGSVDYVLFSLGTNTIVNSNAEFSTIKNTVLSNMGTLIEKLHEQYPSAVVLLCTLQKGSMRGGFGYNFGTAYNANGYFYNRKVYQLNQAYMEFASTRSYVKLVDVSGEFDTLYCYPHNEANVNVRDSTDKELIDTNFGHPSSSVGYKMMADAMYRALCGALSNS